MSKIYTKKGDTGNTILLNGEKVTKDCVSLRVVGELDELNCVLGIAISTIKEVKNQSRLLDMLVAIQRDLFLAGAEISALQSIVVSPDLVGRGRRGCSVVIPTTHSLRSVQAPEESLSGSTVIPAKAGILSLSIKKLETQIDTWSTILPPLKNFILPGGHPAAGHLHLSRAICRRTERELVALGKEKQIPPELYKYFNRLSDWLFTAARYVNHNLEIKEIKAG